MAGKKAGAQRRVAEGIYERNGSYLVPIYVPGKDGEKARKVWHGPGCAGACSHVEIVDLSSARTAKRQLEESKRQGGKRVTETCDAWAARWLTVFPRLQDSTNVHNAERVKSFARDFKGRALASVTKEEARVWILGGEARGDVAKRAAKWGGVVKGEGSVTVPAHRSSLKEVRAMFNDAVKIELVDVNPFDNMGLATGRGRRDIQVLTTPELEQLLAIARKSHGTYGVHMAAMIEAAAWSGLRPGELFLLSFENHGKVNFVDFRAGEILVEWQSNSKTGKVSRPKNSSARPVVLLPQAERALRSLPQRPVERGPMFLTKHGRPYTQRTHHYYWDPVRKAFAAQMKPEHWLPRRIAEKGEAGNLDFYELRHFFGTALANPPVGVRPATPYEIALQMGHKDGGELAMRVYIHVDQQEARQNLSNAWRQTPPAADTG